MAADQLSLGSVSRSSSPERDDSEDSCPVFIDREGNIVEVMCCDYGFRSNSGRLYQQGYGQIPDSAWTLVSE
jgi:ubiquinol oxidase